MQISEDPISLIVASLGHPDPMVRKSSARYLVGEIPPDYFSRVRSFFEAETHPEVVKWLARAIGKTGRPTALKSLHSKREHVTDGMALDWIDASVALAAQPDASHLHGLLKSSDALARQEGAILAWGVEHITPEAAGQLTSLAADDSAKTRRWAELSLYHHGQLHDAGRFADNLQDADFRLREWTAHVITPLAAPSTLPTLLDMFDEDPSPRVREWVARALAAYDDQDVRHLLTSRWRTEIDPFVREATVIGVISGPRIAEDSAFLRDALELESAPVIVGEMIRTLLRDKSLVADHDIMSSVERAATKHGRFLDIHRLFGRELARTAEEADSAVVSQLQKSPAARFLMRTFQPMSSVHVPRIAIVVALVEEFDFVFEEFRAIGIELAPDIDQLTGRVKYTSRHRFPSGHIADLEVAVLGGMGPIRGAAEATRIVLSSKPAVVAVLGIAGSLHKDVKLCDVVLAEVADNYIEGARATPSEDDAFALDLAGEPFRSDALLVNRGQHLHKLRPTAHENTVALRESLLNSLDSKTLRRIRKAGLIGDFRRFTGPIASGPIVGAATQFAVWLKGRNRAYLAIEMESGGVAGGIYLSSGLSTTRLIIVRGVSDFSDERKKEFDNIADGQIRRIATILAFHTLFGLLDVAHDLMEQKNES